MATLEEEEIARKKLSEQVNEVLSIDIAKLDAQKNLGVLSFAPATPYFDRIKSLFLALRKADLKIFPYPTLAQASDHVTNILNTFRKISTFDPQTGGEINQKNTLIVELGNSYDKAFPALSSMVAYSTYVGTDFERLETEAQESITKIERIAVDAKSKAEAMAQKAEDTLKTIQDVAANVGIAQHAMHFENEANLNKDLSEKWLIATIAASIAAAAWGYWGFFGNGAETALASSAQTNYLFRLIGSRVSVTAVLFFALYWCARNYAAHRHNFVVNRHRHNALRTFQAFIDASGDQETKNAVLIQTTQSIFSQQPSGYGKEAEPEPNKIIEIMRGASKSN